MELVIAEKPSVAKAIAEVLGVKKRMDGYMTGDRYVVSWCVGHLVELAMPEHYDERYSKWRYTDLPILPEQWKYRVSAATKSQFDILKRLMNDSRISGVICATDAGREGELIFRLVYEQAGCTLPVRRLWISSLEESAIRDGFAQLKNGKEYDRLYQAALCRERADWLVGMNASRLYSLLYGQTLKIGRVMTPTLAMITGRENSISAFRPEPFYHVQLSTGFVSQSERMKDRLEAENLRSACHLQTARVTKLEQKSKAEKPPKLYDLTTLQRDANRIYGYTAQQTLDYTQSLYEKKLVTYPRTDSQYLTEDMADAVQELVHATMMVMPFARNAPKAPHIDTVTNNSNVSDHHAIIPTRVIAQSIQTLTDLPAGERDILNLIACRLLCAVADPCLYDETVVTLECAGATFTAKGKVIRQLGWKAIDMDFKNSLGRRNDDHEEPEHPLPLSLCEGKTFSPVTAGIKESRTVPPKHYTEDTILSAMESAGNENMPEDAERRGIGTPATRAAILEKLIASGFIERKGDGKTKSLVPTAMGQALIAVVPEQIQSPIMTAEWEQRLKAIEHGDAEPEDFMRDIEALLKDLTANAKRIPNAEEIFPSEKESLGHCPACGAPVTENPKGFFCDNRTCKFGVWKDNRFLVSKGKTPTASMMKILLKDGTVRLTGLKSDKSLRLYDANLLLECAEDGSTRLRLSFEKSEK